MVTIYVASSFAISTHDSSCLTLREAQAGSMVDGEARIRYYPTTLHSFIRTLSLTKAETIKSWDAGCRQNCRRKYQQLAKNL